MSVPFEDFCLVSGPRLVEGAEPLRPEGGLYQIGMTVSKFRMAAVTTEVENFRPGPFELDIREIGFLLEERSTDADAAVSVSAGGAAAAVVPETLTEAEEKKGGLYSSRSFCRSSPPSSQRRSGGPSSA